MKKLFLSLVLCVSLALVSTPASARGVIFYSTGDQLEIFQELPADFQFEFHNGEHMNLGVLYQQFSIMWIPVWNYGETKWVYVNDAKDAYSDDINEEEIEMIRTEYGYDIPEEPRIGFWNKIGGKLVWGVLIAGVVIFGRNKKDDDEQEPTAQSEQPAVEGEPVE